VRASLSALDKIDPDRQDLWRVRRIEFLRRIYRYSRGRKEKRPAGEKFIDALMKTGALHERNKRWTDAMSAYREARMVASSLGLPSRREEIRSDWDRASYLKKSDQKIAGYRKALADKPAHAATRMLLLRALMVDMDDPDAAVKALTESADEAWRTYVPLAAGDVSAVRKDAAKELGDWYYRDLTDKTIPFVKRRMLIRARSYYERYLVTTEAEDETSLRVRLALREIEKVLAKQAAAFSRDMINFATRRNRLPPARQIEALKKKLAEVNGDELVKLVNYQTRGRQIVGLSLENRRLVSIEPLLGLPLTRLSLQGCSSLRSLRGVQGLKLQSLSLRFCRSIESLEGLQDMPLTSLDLQGWAQLKSPSRFRILKGLKLERLNLMECANLVDLKGVEEMPLVWVNLMACGSLTSIAPLKGMKLKSLRMGSGLLDDLSPLTEMPLTSLGLPGCTALTDLSAIKDLKLKELDLRDCKSLKGLERLKTMPLTSLSLAGCSSLTSLTPLRDMKLKHLDLSRCSSLKSLNGIGTMRLTSLNMAFCRSVTSLKPLREMKLKHLDISGCTSLESLEGIGNMPLVGIKLGGVKLSKADRERLKRIRTLKIIR